ncbi:hypothetical protein BpHYR1_025492 [Brachionus plicatilis]|uniref:Uncharacterized protein n=1 Tax=Brachionus plicatilis TaxID=10195 RepID=A0A3M7PB27_BRAPC|nr:hypothetical protein BpHYR1_025492 [Brachionus plicatilis]
MEKEKENFDRFNWKLLCWAAAKPGRSERGQKSGPLTWPAKLKTDGHFGGQTKSAKRKIFKY